MKMINIKMRLGHVQNPTVTVNGELVEFKKSGNEYVASVETEFDTVELEVRRFHEIKGALWWLYSLLFFVFGVFGIFDVGCDRKCLGINYKATLHLAGDTNVSLAFDRPKAGAKAVECRCDCAAEQTANAYYLDVIAKKRMKIMRIIKALTWVALVVGAIVTTVLVTIYA